MSKKAIVEFVVKGKVEASVTTLASYILESKSKRGRKKKLVLESEENEENSRKTMNFETPDFKANYPSSGSESQTKKKGRSGRKKKDSDDEEIEEFPAPKSKSNRGRGQGRRGRPARKTPDQSLKEDTNSMISSSKNDDEDSISQLDENLEVEEEEEEMKLEDDDDDLMEEEDEGDDNFDQSFNPLSMSTKNILRLSKMQQDESASSDKNTPDINNLNIDVNKLTRRQKAQLKNQVNLDIDVEEPLMELPDKKTKKRKDEALTEEQQMKKMESANKRKILNQKLQEEQKKQTINRILNEAGRKQKQRKEKEQQSKKEKESHKFRTLPEGEVGIKYVSRAHETFLALPKDFSAETLFINL